MSRLSPQTRKQITDVLERMTQRQRELATELACRAWMAALADLDGPVVAAEVAYRLADEFVG